MPSLILSSMLSFFLIYFFGVNFDFLKILFPTFRLDFVLFIDNIIMLNTNLLFLIIISEAAFYWLRTVFAESVLLLYLRRYLCIFFAINNRWLGNFESNSILFVESLPKVFFNLFGCWVLVFRNGVLDLRCVVWAEGFGLCSRGWVWHRFVVWNWSNWPFHLHYVILSCSWAFLVRWVLFPLFFEALHAI